MKSNVRVPRRPIHPSDARFYVGVQGGHENGSISQPAPRTNVLVPGTRQFVDSAKRTNCSADPYLDGDSIDAGFAQPRHSKAVFVLRKYGLNVRSLSDVKLLVYGCANPIVTLNPEGKCV